MTTTPGVTKLRLARTSGTAVRGGDACGLTVSRGMHTLGEPAPCFTNRRYLLVLHLDQSTGSPAAALGHRLLVGGKVEEDEEEEVRREDADTGDGGEFLAGALTHVGKVRPVGASKVGPGGEVHEAWSRIVNEWTGISESKQTHQDPEQIG